MESSPLRFSWFSPLRGAGCALYGCMKTTKESVSGSPAMAHNKSMKKFIFADRTIRMNHFEITALNPMLAIRELVAKHGQQPYRIVNIVAA